ncbi:MAG: hypothetical protein JNL70_04010 [Saprospiraceae bacterium]|nr:hypothetical protein [Saprospiraceae bacterium]
MSKLLKEKFSFRVNHSTFQVIRKSLKILSTVSFLLFYVKGWTQTTASVGVSISLPSVALLDIEPNNSAISLSLTAPTEGGNQLTATTTNNSKWLNFTSAVSTGTTRRIGVQMSGSLPNGVNLKLTTANYAGSGAGNRGSAVSIVYLSGSQQTIVNNIGGGYTGTGSNNGYNLTYSLEISNYALLRSQSATVTLVYTLIDN